MAFENVSPDGLNTAVNICKNSINYSESLKSLNAIASSTVWQANAKSKLNNSLEKLINDKYQKIIDYLNDISTASSLISQYKSLVSENDNYNHQIYNLQSELYYDEEYTVPFVDEEGNETFITQTRTVKDTYVERRIEELITKINNNNEQMRNIERNVSNLVE